MDDKLREIICDVFKITPEDYHEQLTSEEVERWDSVAHITLLLTLEQSFGVSFEPEERNRLTSVPAIRAALTAHNATQSD